jgi:hypothetical protein
MEAIRSGAARQGSSQHASSGWAGALGAARPLACTATVESPLGAAAAKPLSWSAQLPRCVCSLRPTPWGGGATAAARCRRRRPRPRLCPRPCSVQRWRSPLRSSPPTRRSAHPGRPAWQGGSEGSEEGHGGTNAVRQGQRGLLHAWPARPQTAGRRAGARPRGKHARAASRAAPRRRPRPRAPTIWYEPSILPAGVRSGHALSYWKRLPGRSTGCSPTTPGPRTWSTWPSPSVMTQCLRGRQQARGRRPSEGPAGSLERALALQGQATGGHGYLPRQ